MTPSKQTVLPGDSEEEGVLIISLFLHESGEFPEIKDATAGKISGAYHVSCVLLANIWQRQLPREPSPAPQERGQRIAMEPPHHPWLPHALVLSGHGSQ